MGLRLGVFLFEKKRVFSVEKKRFGLDLNIRFIEPFIVFAYLPAVRH